MPEIDGAPASGAPPPATSSSVIVTVVGMPSATPDASPKLFVMSWRTTPLSVRTFGPFEPSPGYGPAVSSGISLALAVPADSDDEPPHATSTAEPKPPSITPSALRRLIRRGRS